MFIFVTYKYTMDAEKSALAMKFYEKGTIIKKAVLYLL